MRPVSPRLVRTSGMPARHVSRNAMSNISINKPLSLTRNFSWTLSRHWAVCTLPVGDARRPCEALQHHMVGQFALALAITAPVFVFAGLT